MTAPWHDVCWVVHDGGYKGVGIEKTHFGCGEYRVSVANAIETLVVFLAAKGVVNLVVKTVYRCVEMIEPLRGRVSYPPHCQK